MSSIAELLQNTLSPIQSVREDASNKLESLAQSDFPQYIGLLCTELANEQLPSHLRRSAGLLLKNSLSSRDVIRQAEFTTRWVSTDATFRAQVKTSILATIVSPDVGAGTAAGQVATAIAVIELSRGEWNDLIPSLLDKIMTLTSDAARQSSLQALGFICEAVEPHILASQSNAILNAVALGARKEETNPAVRLAAIQALYNSLEFIRGNFDNEGERNYIMQIICETTQSENSDVQVAAFECLVRVMSLYYDKMVFYMQKALYQLTLLGMRHDNEKVALQAIEFWSTVAETESEIAYEVQEAYEAGEVPDRQSYQFAQSALSQIVPSLLWLMTKKEDEEDEDEWNVSMAAATCLSLFAGCVCDHIIPHVLPMIEQNIKNEDWRNREAAVMAFGSILEGPDPNQLGELVRMALPTLLQLMSDPVVQVKDTTAWTLSRVCQNLVQFIKPEEMPQLVTVILTGLADSPRVAVNCAWCIINLAENTSPTGDEDHAESSPLSPYFEAMLTGLNQCGERAAQDPHLRASVYEAMAMLVSNCSNDCLPSVQNLTAVLLQRLADSIAVHSQLVGADDRRMHFEFQANMCSVLTSIVRRVGPPIASISDNIMNTLLLVISNASKVSTVMEDAFLVIGALATAIEAHFVRYMDSFLPFLSAAMQNHEEHQLCTIAVGLVGDICRALNEAILPYCEGLMQVIGQLLTNPKIHSSVKPACLAVLGDMALAIGSKFAPFAQPALKVIHTMAEEIERMPLTTGEQVEFSYQMREGIAEAYVGIVQGLKSGDSAHLIVPHTSEIFTFLNRSTADQGRPESLTRSIVGLVGDLAEILPLGTMKPLFSEEWIQLLLREIKTDRSVSISTKEVGKWTREMVRRQLAA